MDTIYFYFEVNEIRCGKCQVPQKNGENKDLDTIKLGINKIDNKNKREKK